MSQYHDNQLNAAMMMRQYGLRPNMPGYGYQLQSLSSAMSNTGLPEGGPVEPGNLPGTGGQTWQDQNPQGPTYDPSGPTAGGNPGSYPTQPSDNPGGIVGGLNDNFTHSPIGQGVAALRALFGHHDAVVPRAPQDINFTDLNDPANDWRQNATHGQPGGPRGGGFAGWGTGPALSQPTFRNPQVNSIVFGYQPTGESQQWGLGQSAENSAQNAYLRQMHRI